MQPEQQPKDQEKIWMSDDILAYHRRQLEEPYRSTIHMIRFIKSILPDPKGDALDVACGTGVNILHMSPAFPHLRWTGVDYAGDKLYPVSRPYFQKANLQPELITGDVYKLTQLFPNRRFPVILCAHTLICLPGYEEVLDQMLTMLDGWLFISSLFADTNIDARIEVIDYTREDGVRVPQYYNVYSLRRFKKFCEDRGAQEFIAQDFEIDVDLPQNTDGRGTYTRKLEDGRRLQFTGPVWMPWKYVAVKKVR